MEIPFQNRASCKVPPKIEGKRANTKRDLKKVAQICALTLKAVKGPYLINCSRVATTLGQTGLLLIRRVEVLLYPLQTK